MTVEVVNGVLSPARVVHVCHGSARLVHQDLNLGIEKIEYRKYRRTEYSESTTYTPQNRMGHNGTPTTWNGGMGEWKTQRLE